MTDQDRRCVRPPSWTVLPPLELRGLGTPLVESLQHYCLRLAWMTGLSLGAITRLASSSSGGIARDGKYRNSLCGPGTRFVAITHALERMTGNNDLRHGTLWVLKDVIGGGLGSHTDFRRWCPTCYAAWGGSIAEIAEPLAWQIGLLGTCLVHGCAIEDKCRLCGSQQNAATPLGRRAFCMKCSGSLAWESQVTQTSDFFRWVDCQLESLIKLCGTPGQQPIPEDSPLLFCEMLARQADAHGRAPVAFRRFIYATDRNARKFSRKPSIRALVNLCAMQGISVCDALLRPTEAAAKPLLDLWTGFHAIPVPQRLSRAHVNDAAWCLHFLMVKLEGGYLPPMECVFRPLRVLRAVARDVAPDIYELYEDSYQRQGTKTELLYARMKFDHAMAKMKDDRSKGRRRTSVGVLARGLARRFKCGVLEVDTYAESAVVVDEMLREAKLWKSNLETTRIAEYTDWLKGR